MKKLLNYVSAETIYPQAMLEYGKFFRELALGVDQDPNYIKYYLTHSSMTHLMDDSELTCLERTKRFECLSYGDVGVLLAAPGPSLAGQLVRELGSAEQQAYFQDTIVAHHARTFLAVTEPPRGSDAANLTTKIINKDAKLFMSGEKCFVGNGAIGEVGVVIAKLSPGPVGMVAVLVAPFDRVDGTLERSLLPTVGLRGASLSHLIFNQHEISRDQLLGGHLRIVHRGLMGLMKTFNRMRTCVGALGLGLSQAVLDYAYEVCPKHQKQIAHLSLELAAARKILYAAASRIDEDVTDSAAASMAKVIATRMAEKIVNQVLAFFGPEVFWEHPLLEKWHRDVYGFEFMEGTMQIHYKNVAQKYLINNKFS